MAQKLKFAIAYLTPATDQQHCSGYPSQVPGQAIFECVRQEPLRVPDLHSPWPIGATEERPPKTLTY